MKKYRRRDFVELVEPQPFKHNDEVRILRIQTAGEPDHQWLISEFDFKAKYELVEDADYTILTAIQRESLRDKFYEVGIHIINASKSPGQAIAVFQLVQKHAGEFCKSFEHKVSYIDAVVDRLNIFEKNHGLDSVFTEDGHIAIIGKKI